MPRPDPRPLQRRTTDMGFSYLAPVGPPPPPRLTVRGCSLGLLCALVVGVGLLATAGSFLLGRVPLGGAHTTLANAPACVTPDQGDCVRVISGVLSAARQDAGSRRALWTVALVNGSRIDVSLLDPPPAPPDHTPVDAVYFQGTLQRLDLRGGAASVSALTDAGRRSLADVPPSPAELDAGLSALRTIGVCVVSVGLVLTLVIAWARRARMHRGQPRRPSRVGAVLRRGVGLRRLRRRAADLDPHTAQHPPDR